MKKRKSLFETNCKTDLDKLFDFTVFSFTTFNIFMTSCIISIGDVDYCNVTRIIVFSKNL